MTVSTLERADKAAEETSADKAEKPAASRDEDDSRRRRDPEATRAAILDAAEELFVAQGLADTPTSQIARQAGVTKSLIHHHFGSKEELWQEIKRRHFDHYYEAQRRMLDSRGTAEMLRQSIVAYFRFLQSDPRSVRFMTWRIVESDDPCLAQEDELFALGIERIREAQEAGELRSDLDPISLIKSFLALSLHWFQTKPLLCQMLRPGDDPDALEEKYLEDILKIFFDGARPRPAA